MKLRKQISKRIIELRDELIEKGVVKNKTDFADNIGSYTGAIAALKQEGGREAPIDMIIRVLEVYRDYISPNELFGFDMAKNNIYFLSEAAAGPSISVEAKRNYDTYRIPNLTGELFAFEVKGDSMYPTIEYGDILVCEKINNQSELKNNKIYVIVSQDGVNVKRISLKDAENGFVGITLISDNYKIYTPFDLDFSIGLHSSPSIEFYKPLKRITENGLF